MEVGPGARLADIACGTGIVSRAAARRIGNIGAVTGVDLGLLMLGLAQDIPGELLSAPIT